MSHSNLINNEGTAMVVIKSFFNMLGSIVSKVKLLGATFGLLIAVALAIFFGVAGFFVPTKVLGVVLSALGCFGAGWLFSASLSKFVSFGAKDSEAGTTLQHELKEKESIIQRLETTVNSLRAENKHLENQRIDINAIRPVFKLGLMDANMSISDVKIVWDNDFEEEGIFSKAQRSQYIGVLRRSFKASYGVDLAKLYVKDDVDCIHIAGIETENLGFKDVNIEWLVRQIQTYSLKSTSETAGGPIPSGDPTIGFKHLENFYEIDRQEPFTGTLNRERTAYFSEQQEKDLSKRLDKGVGEEFYNLNNYITNMAKSVIQLLLSPVGKRVDFVETSLAQISVEDGWMTLEDFVNGFNKNCAPTQIESRVVDKNRGMVSCVACQDDVCLQFRGQNVKSHDNTYEHSRQ